MVVAGLVAPAAKTLDSPTYLDGASMHKREREAAARGEYVDQRLPILVLNGGRTTCDSDANGDPLYRRHMVVFGEWGIARAAEAVAAGRRTPVLVMTCFGYDAVTMKLRSSLEPGLTHVMPPGELAPYLERIAEDEPFGVEMFFYAHSYGAHLAMKTIAALPPSMTPAIVQTNDPISPLGCGPATYVSKGLARIVRRDLVTPLAFRGCSNFPEDLDEASLARVAKAELWINSWQDRFTPLHSGPAPGAHRNVWMAYGPESWNAHDDHAVDKRVFALFEEAWRNRLRRAQAGGERPKVTRDHQEGRAADGRVEP